MRLRRLQPNRALRSNGMSEDIQECFNEHGNRRDRVTFHQKPAFKIFLARAIKEVCRSDIGRGTVGKHDSSVKRPLMSASILVVLVLEFF